MTPTVNQNSYVNMEDADTYFSNRLYSENWNDAELSTREKALLMAATMLDLHFEWRGQKDDPAQAMEFPRKGMTDTPRAIKTAQMELALLLLQTDLTALPTHAGIKSEKVDVLAVEYDTTYKPPVVPDRINSLIEPFLAIPGAFFCVTR